MIKDNIIPVVFQKDGEIFANSRYVAEYFGKSHKNVLRDINEVSSNLSRSPLTDTNEINPNLDTSLFARMFHTSSYLDQYEREQPSFDMTKDGFMLLVMGYTGKKAFAFKLKYIEQFNAMEDALRNGGPDLMQVLKDPAKVRALLVDYSDNIIALEEELKELEPEVEGFRRIAAVSDGSSCITDTAKDLQMRPKDLFVWLQSHKWIYRRAGCAHWVGYQDKIQTGRLEHKVTEVTSSDGSSKITEQVRVTRKGLTSLAKTINNQFV